MAGDDRVPARVSRAELERRWALARTAMAALRLDALVMQSERDYAGGYSRWFTDHPAANPRSVVVFPDTPMLVVEHGPGGRRRTLDGNDARHPGVAELINTAAFPSAHQTQRIDGAMVAEALRARGCRRIGLVAPDATRHGFIATLHAGLPDAELLDATEAVDTIKAFKSEEEIAAMTRVAAMQDEVLRRVLAFIRPGLRDSDVMAFARYQGMLLGSEQGLFLGSSAPMGQPAFYASHNAQGRVLRAGDTLSILVENNGAGGYYCELGRTIILGTASADLREAFANVLAAQQATVAQLVDGADPAAIARAHDVFMQARGLPPEDRLYAHSQGYDLVERPLIRADETIRIANGMNFAVHPGYVTPGLFITVCDNFLVTPNGPRRLHATEQRLFELG